MHTDLIHQTQMHVGIPLLLVGLLEPILCTHMTQTVTDANEYDIAISVFASVHLLAGFF